jgi:hypothetical protein
MSTSRRAADSVGFVVLLLAALGLLWWRSVTQSAGLSAEQGESLTLARSLVDGLGLRWTSASSVSPGPPNLPWLLVQAGVLRAGGDPFTWLPRLAGLFIGLSLVVVALRGAWVWKRAPRLEDALPALGMAGATAMAEAVALGSGASVGVLGLSLAAVLLSRSLGSGRAVLTGLAIGSLTAWRPSAAWLLVAAVPAWWIAARLEGRRATREAVTFLLAGLVVVLSVFGVRLVVLGGLPLDGLLPCSDGVAQTVEFLGRQSRWFWAAVMATTIAVVWRRFHLRGGGTLLAWVSMTVVLASWTEAPRSLFLGCAPLLAMLVGDGLSAAREGARGDGRDAALRKLSWLAFAAMLLGLGLAAITSFQLGPLMVPLAEVKPQAELRDELARRGVRQPLVAWTDGREAAALFPEARVVVVKKPSAALEDLLVSEGPPDLVDARVEVAAMPRLAEQMATGAGATWWLAEQTPDDDPRCVDGRLALLSTTPEQLAAQLERELADEQVQRALGRWRCALAALAADHLPAPARRAELATIASGRSLEFERQGRLELAVRAAALAASLSGESVNLRARAERLRETWLSQR